jgi:hypothetical protein
MIKRKDLLDFIAVLIALVAVSIAIIRQNHTVFTNTIFVYPSAEEIAQKIVEYTIEGSIEGGITPIRYFVSQKDTTYSYNVGTSLDTLLDGEFILIPINIESLEEDINDYGKEEIYKLVYN